MRDPITPIKPLVCDECLRAEHDGDGRGWRADWAGGHDGQPFELVVLCPGLPGAVQQLHFSAG